MILSLCLSYTALEVEFTKSQIVAAIPGTFFCAWYASRKHWLANNILGLAFCIQVCLCLFSYRIALCACETYKLCFVYFYCFWQSVVTISYSSHNIINKSIIIIPTTYLRSFSMAPFVCIGIEFQGILAIPFLNVFKIEKTKAKIHKWTSSNLFFDGK